MKTLMKPITYILVCALSCTLLSASATTDPATLTLFEETSKFLNDVSSRRSRVVYTHYPVSARHGVQQGFVHIKDGSLAFARTDLLVDAGMPLLVKRVYWSSRETPTDFGLGGWKLSIAESLEEVDKDVIRYTYGNDNTVLINRQQQALSAFDALMTDVLAVNLKNNDATITTRNGLVKHFVRSGNRYLLDRVSDEFNRFVQLIYTDDGKIERVENSDGGHVSFSRNAQGFVTQVQDQHGRVVVYRYNALGLLAEHDDIRGETWKYHYNSDGNLVSAETPNGLTDIDATYDSDERVASSSINGFSSQFSYSIEDTSVTDHLGTTVYRSAPNGLTTYVRNPAGTETRIEVNTAGLPNSLHRNNREIASLSYRGGHLGLQPTIMSGAVSGTSYSVVYDRNGRISRILNDGHNRALVEHYNDGLTPQITTLADEGRRLSSNFHASGDLAHVDFEDGRSWSFQRAAGNWSVTSDNRTNTLSFSPSGQLNHVTTFKDFVLDYFYDAGGFRERTEVSDGVRVTYHYDASGSLFYTTAGYVGQEQQGYNYVANPNNTISRVDSTTGDSHEIDYNDAGLPTAFRSPLIANVTFDYDALGRLITVQQDGKAPLVYDYDAGESDIVLQNDTRSATVYSQHREIPEFGSRLELWLSRIQPASLGVFTFTAGTREIAIPFNVKQWHPLSPIHHSLESIELASLFSTVSMFGQFSSPSNRLFVPKELWSVNCCICGPNHWLD